MTALKIGKPSKLKSGQIAQISASSQASKSHHSISTAKMTSNSNVRESNNNYSYSRYYYEEDVNKGQTVMNSLKKMWDRRLLRQIKDGKKE